MKPAILIPIILGSVLLVAGGVMFGIGLANASKQDATVTREYELEAFTALDVETQTADVEFKPSADGTRKVVVEEKEKQYHTVEVANDVLTIKGFDARKWYEYIFSFNWSKMKITIFVPEGEFSSANIRVGTGNIFIPDSFRFQTLNAKTSTGRIDIKTHVFDTAVIEASTGDISFEGSAKSLAVKASTGDITLNKVSIEEGLTVETSTGHQTHTDVQARNVAVKATTGGARLLDVVAQENLTIKTSVGDVSLQNCDAASLIDIETSTGNVQGSLRSGKLFDVQTKTGRIDCPPSTSGSGTCKVRTSTGDITLSIAEA